MSELYIGLMSGTSLDGIDAALVEFTTTKTTLLAHFGYALSQDLRNAILSLRQPGFNEILRLAELDVILGQEFANAVNSLLQKHEIANSKIRGIGSHGQTIRHLPNYPFPFTLQIGDPNIIAAKTGITTVADFRRRDIAFGGQGAPLVPAFHQALFASDKKNRIIVNIGGIANVTILPCDTFQPVLGFDTGPGNTLMDAWIHKHLQQLYDKKGEWAARGTVNEALLMQLLNDPFFKLPPPKSTGQEYFNLIWLNHYLPEKIEPVDVQATLVELTARTILEAITPHLPTGEIYICGGGAHNDFLLSRLRTLTAKHSIDTTQKLGIDPDWMEAMAFAWLAKQTLDGKPGNLITVTGAKRQTILGGVYFA